MCIVLKEAKVKPRNYDVLPTLWACFMSQKRPVGSSARTLMPQWPRVPRRGRFAAASWENLFGRSGGLTAPFRQVNMEPDTGVP